MKIYVIIQNSIAVEYGVGTYIRELIHSLKGYNLSITIVELRSEKKTFTIQSADGIEYLYIPAPQKICLPNYDEEQNERYHRNVLYLLKLHIDARCNPIFHFNFFCASLISLANKAFNCKTVLVVHYLKWAIEYMGNQTRFENEIFKSAQRVTHSESIFHYFYNLDKKSLKAANAIVCLSEYTYHLLSRHYQIPQNCMTIISNGLLKQSSLITSKEKIREKWMLANNERIILFVGRLDKIKGVSTLTAAFREVIKTLPSCRLIMSGTGDYSQIMSEIPLHVV